MSRVDIDLILNKLSVKFNRIFCDREFVGCVIEDFQIVIENKNKCCVLVFPVLSPNYLKAIRYQAKYFDLAVFPLVCRNVQSIAVCHKKYLLQTTSSEEPKENTKMSDKVPEPCDGALRKKRPERQLYVPPAQRKSRLSTENSSQQNKKIAPQIIQKRNIKTEKDVADQVVQRKYLLSLEDLSILYNINFFFWNYKVTKNDHVHNCQKKILFTDKSVHLPSQVVTIFNTSSPNQSLYILDCFYFCWQPKLNFSNSFRDYNTSGANLYATYPVYNFEKQNDTHFEESFYKSVIPVGYDWLITTYKREFEDYLKPEKSAFKIECNNESAISECWEKVIDLSLIEKGHMFIIEFLDNLYFFECLEDHHILDCYLRKQEQLKINIEEQTLLSKKINDTRISPDATTNINMDTKPATRYPSNNIIVLENRIECPVQNNNLKNTLISADTTPKEKNTKKLLRKTSQHEEEKEIMRKTKENINRKSRPIIKYVESDDTLSLGKNDNVNNWEDLFNDDGELQDEIFTEIIHKVGSDVTIVKASEDYSGYAVKQMEELEHMVELYDFPSNFETHDIISAFSELHSDSMYVKWVDETHALLVLGSLTQAQRAIEVCNPLIKVRPMSAASSISMAKANKFDLRPAMKRPQTNLQTARRLITTHLGAKSRVSKEQSAKEKEDLRAAKELKKMIKRNEKDAWEGSLRSSINN